jgi:hypothetical protein
MRIKVILQSRLIFDLGVPAKKTEKKSEPPWATQILNQ